MSFSAVEENFYCGVRDGFDVALYWLGLGEVFAFEFVLCRLLLMVYDGLECWGVDVVDCDWLLGMIERCCLDF